MEIETGFLCILTIKESEGEEGSGFQGGACLT